ncbi:monocarboxylate transporter 2-like [Rhinophrynus dorsalis]
MRYIPPDGGWGWVIVFGAFISIGLPYAFPSAITIFYKEFQDVFGAASSDVAWISSILQAAMYGGGPVSSILVNRFGCRPVVIFGGLLSGMGMVIASFSTSIIHIYILVGVLTGFGLCLNLQPSVIAIEQYFLKHRPLANGLAITGIPAILSILSPLNQFLFDKYGWRGSFLILGALLLNCCVAGSLFRPIRPISPLIKNQKKKSAEDPEKKPICESYMETKQLQSHKFTKNKEKKEEKCNRKCNKLLDINLFKHRGFLIYLVGNVLMLFAYYVPVVFLAQNAKHLSVDEYSAAFLLSIYAIVAMIATPTTGIIANSKWIRPRIQYLLGFSIIFYGFCQLMCPFAKGYKGLVVYSVFFGLAYGMITALRFETLKDLVEDQCFSSAVGLVSFAECFPILLGAPIGGFLIDTFGAYKFMYYEVGSILVSQESDPFFFGVFGVVKWKKPVMVAESRYPGLRKMLRHLQEFGG